MDKNSMIEGSSVIKWKTYFLTFMAYVALHTMRMSYSQIKPNFQMAFNESNFFLGLFDGLVYLSLSCGFFFRFLIQGKKTMIKTYIIFMTIASLAYLIIPISSLILESAVTSNYVFQYVLPGVGLLLFGFCQFPAWPTLLTLICQYFDLKTEGKQMGFWAANGDVGNIVGFALAGLLVNSLQFRWETAMIVAAAFNLIMARWVYVYVSEVHQSSHDPLYEQLLQDLPKPSQSMGQSNANNQNSHSKFQIFLQYSREIIRPTENKLYLLALGLLKAILYGFLLWMPTYLAHNGLSNYKSPVLIIFNAGTLVGSFVLGYFYERSAASGSVSQNIRVHMKRYSLFYSCIGLTVSLALLYYVGINITAYYILSGICGAFLGGCFNMMASNQIIEMTEGKKENVSMLSTLSMSFGNLMVGIVEIIIGVILDLKNDAQGEGKLFVILVCLGVLAMYVLYTRSKILAQKSVQSNDQQMLPTKY